MAERRMFSKSVIGSARFLRMPPSSRLLYYDLGMAADDDGVVEAFSVMRMTGAVEDDLKVLVSKGFITVLNEDLVAYIEDWSKNNQIRKDRYQPSIYQNLLVQIGAVNQLETVGQPDGNQRLNQDIPLYNLYLLLTSVSSSTSVSFDIDRCRTVAGCFGVDALDIPLPGFFHIWHKCRESHAFNG